MELHYLTLQRLVEEIRPVLLSGTVRDSYTQQKQEQVLEVESATGQMWQVRLSVQARYPSILLRKPIKRARLSTSVVPQLVGLRIKDLTLWEGERVIMFCFENSDLRYLIQLFRNQSNFFLVDARYKIVSAFKKQKKYAGRTYRLKENRLLDPRRISVEQFLAKLQSSPEAPLALLLRRGFMFNSPDVVREVCYRTGLPDNLTIEDIPEEKLRELFRQMRIFLSACLADLPRIYWDQDYPVAFALTELSQWAELKCLTYPSVNEALTTFVFRRQKMDRLKEKKKQIGELIDQKIAQLEHIINQLNSLPDEVEKRAFYQRMGELLLAQLPNIMPGSEEVELIDYFDTDQRRIRVRLNPNLSPRQNAENYFRKAKETGKRHQELEVRIKQLKKDRAELGRMRERFLSTQNYKELSRIEKRLMEMHILQTAPEKMEEVYRPYKRYFFRDWEIWVGKNARANDELTFRTAHKEDWWLHAQGASGSHVVVRNPRRQEHLPPEVKEYAARLAAVNSSARHSSYVPVIITRVKYVRKPRGAGAGVVLPERTKTIFVEPQD